MVTPPLEARVTLDHPELSLPGDDPGDRLQEILCGLKAATSGREAMGRSHGRRGNKNLNNSLNGAYLLQSLPDKPFTCVGCPPAAHTCHLQCCSEWLLPAAPPKRRAPRRGGPQVTRPRRKNSQVRDRTQEDCETGGMEGVKALHDRSHDVSDRTPQSHSGRPGRAALIGERERRPECGATR